MSRDARIFYLINGTIFPNAVKYKGKLPPKCDKNYQQILLHGIIKEASCSYDFKAKKNDFS